MLLRINEEVDPNLEMAAIHRRVFDAGGPAILFEKVKGSPFPAASNIYGSMDRCKYLFRKGIDPIKTAIRFKGHPEEAIKKPFKSLRYLRAFSAALPKKSKRAAVNFAECKISDLPQIKCWPMDGGPFVTLPQVCSLEPGSTSPMKANLGMYRVQLGGNDYIADKEIGLHYQIHRGIGVHQSKAKALGQPLKVSVFIGGPPSHALSAVMPLPEGLSELTFAGALGRRRFRYHIQEGWLISNDADFVILGEIHHEDLKPEGPFGDHLGYYSLKHDFPLMKVHKVLHRKDAIWPFTVVGRPPQEDSYFGELIHELTGDAIKDELPGIDGVNAVDAAGVHPLLLAVGSERYAPFLKQSSPMELLTQANHILGKGQLSLAKYLFILDKASASDIDLHNEGDFICKILERVDWTRDLHFQTQTTIDTLDYSSASLNEGSKLVIAACGAPKRKLGTEASSIDFPAGLKAQVALPGVLALESDLPADELVQTLKDCDLEEFPLLVLVDDSAFVSENPTTFYG